MLLLLWWWSFLLYQACSHRYVGRYCYETDQIEYKCVDCQHTYRA